MIVAIRARANLRPLFSQVSQVEYGKASVSDCGAVSYGPGIMKAAWTALIVAAICFSWATGDALAQNRAPLPQKRSVSPHDTARLKHIIQGVIRDPNFLTPSIHTEFWQILKKTGASSKQVRALQEAMTGKLSVYYPLYWQDALTSLRNGRPYKSAQRQDYENKMLRRGMISKKELKTNNSLIAQIAAGKPISRQGKKIVVNEKAIQASLGRVRETAKRIERLFSPQQR